MKLTAITCACHRPEAFALCERYMARQSVKPIQWLVIDNDEPKTTCTLGQEYYHWPECSGRESLVLKLRRVLEKDMVKGDAIVFIENDDAYASDWLEWCADKLGSFDLIGEGRALYYNVRHRFWFVHTNLAHASLCQTAISRKIFPDFLRQCQRSLNPYVDELFWRSFRGLKMVFDPKKHGSRTRVVGIKAMPGRTGYGGGHRGRDRSAVADPDLAKLRSLIGADADAYAPFFQPEAEPLPPEKNGFITPKPQPATPRLSAKEWHAKHLAQHGKNQPHAR